MGYEAKRASNGVMQYFRVKKVKRNGKTEYVRIRMSADKYHAAVARRNARRASRR